MEAMVTKRKALLVGSMPFENEEAAMQLALARLGPLLFSLPDGEIGEKSAAYPLGRRSSWVNTAMMTLGKDRSSWRTVKTETRAADGFAVDYNHFEKLVPLRPPSEMDQHLHFGYHEFFAESYPIFQRLRAAHGTPQVKFQLGVPTGLALLFSFRNPVTGLRYIDSFNRYLAREVNQAVQQAPNDVIIQIEVPPELYMAYQLPNLLMGLAQRSIWGLVKRITPGTPIGIHLCLGDFRNEAMLAPKTLDKMVRFSNLLVDHWPSTHPLAYIHYPLAEGATPPRLDAGYYAPLGQIKLPAETQFVAGFIHEKRTTAELGQILAAIESARGAPVAVAASCGLGRRTPEVAMHVIDLTAQVAEWP
jgi:hypothetical protein